MKRKSGRRSTVRIPQSRGAPPSASRPHDAARPREIWRLRLYVAGQTPRSLAAFANLKRLCEEHLPGRYHIEVVDLVKSPEFARADQIVALPTLVRKLPTPVKRVIGDLSNKERVMVAIDLEKGTLPPEPTPTP